MPWFRKYMLQDKAGEGTGGGGNPPPAPDLASLQAKIDALEARLAAGNPPPAPNDKDKEKDDLLEAARKERERLNNEGASNSQLESALKFDLSSTQWLKENSGLLPNDIPDLFEAAKKQNYGTAVEKANAIKSGIIQSYFGVQANLDLLTTSQKNRLDEYLKLTKNVRDTKAPEVYESLFEPTFEMAKRLRKADLLSRGLGDSTNDNYKKRLIEGAQKHYFKKGG